MSKTALVTGGAGFIGSHIVDALLKEDYKVYALDNLSSGKKENVNPKADLLVEDIREVDFTVLLNSLKPSLIIHAAAQISVSKSMEDPLLDIDINIKGTTRLLDSLNKTSLADKTYFVFLSTGGAMYGESCNLPAKESDNALPLSVYGCSKRACEILLSMWHKVYGLKCCSLRLANVYGPRQDPHGEAGVVAIFSLKLIKGEVPIIFGDGEQTRDFIYIDDVVRAVLLSNKRKLEGIYNVGTGKETSVNCLYKELCQCAKTDVKPHYAEPREGEQRRSSISFEKIKKECGFSPKVSLKEGLEKTYSWFLKNKDF